MTTIEGTDNSIDSFSRDFEEYRRARRAKFEEQKNEYDAPHEVDLGSNDGEEIEETAEVQAIPPTQATLPTSSVAQCNTTARDSPEKTPVGVFKTSSTERRNSFSKFMSSLSNVFKPPPTLTPQEKEKANVARKKREQDENMAHLIAQLEFEGKSDEEIQMHLFHLRDVAQHARPRSNSLVGDWFRDLNQAVKDEFNLRRGRQCMTVHVAEVNPFAAAMPANYVHDTGLSYEDLLRLEPVPRGMLSLDHLPTLVFEGQELPSSQTTCAVCITDFEVSEELRALECAHHFHKECIDKWLGVAPSCPVCKGEVSNA